MKNMKKRVRGFEGGCCPPIERGSRGREREKEVGGFERGRWSLGPAVSGGEENAGFRLLVPIVDG